MRGAPDDSGRWRLNALPPNYFLAGAPVTLDRHIVGLQLTPSALTSPCTLRPLCNQAGSPIAVFSQYPAGLASQAQRAPSGAECDFGGYPAARSWLVI